MILTLIAVPVFYSLVDDATNAFQRFVARIAPGLDHEPEGATQSA